MRGILLITTAMLFALTGCGGDKKSSSNNGYFSNSYSTQEGFFNLQTNSLTVNGQTVMPADQQSIMIVNQALSVARNTVQPIMSNNMYGYRARITAQIYSPNYGYNTGYAQSGYGQVGYVQSGIGYNTGTQTVTISSVQFY